MTKKAQWVWYAILVAKLLILGGLVVPNGAAASDQAHFGSQINTAQPTPDPFTETLIGDLKKKGFRVSQGYPKLYTIDDCKNHTYPALKNCFLANPAAPYVVPVVKLWPHEYVEPTLVNAFVETEPGYSVSYRFHPRDAIVIYGRMPPAGRYMGLQTWAFSERGKWKPEYYDQWANTPDLPIPMQYLFQTVPPNDLDSKRIITFSAIGDVINNVVMERQSGYPFEQKTRYFIITPSASTDRAVRRALQAQGVPKNFIFTEQIPGKDAFGRISPLGISKNAIDFITAFRYTVPEPAYQEAADAWRNNPPLTVLRLRAPASLGPVKRYKSLTFESRSAHSEAALAGDLQNLVDAVCAKVSGNSNLTSTDCSKPPLETSFIPELVRDYGWTGPYCRKIGMNCQADQQEAALFFSSPRSLNAGEVLAVIGTLATETNNATYVALSANDASMMAGVANVLDTDLRTNENKLIKGLKGSADSYSGTVNNTGKFFVHYFAKDCSVLSGMTDAVENCSNTQGVEPPIGDPSLSGQFIIALRDYIAPGTQRGPDTSNLLTPRILTFTQSIQGAVQ